MAGVPPRGSSAPSSHGEASICGSVCGKTLNDSTFVGLLHLHPDQDGISSTLNFSHTTKQEYFAAYHLSQLPEAEQAAFWRKNHHNPKFAVVLKFVAGLTKLQSPIVSKAVIPTGGSLPPQCDTDNPYLLYVFHALFESQNGSLTQRIATQLSNCLTFDLYLTHFDTMVLSHCLTKCKHLTELHICKNTFYSLPPTSFHHVCSVVRSNPLQSLLLRVAQFSIEDAKELCEASLLLKKLDLGVVHSTHEALAVIFSLPKLEELALALYHAVEPVGDSTVLKGKVAHCHLKRLKLFGYRNLLPLLSGIKDNSSVTDLDVVGSPSEDVASAVAACGRMMRQLRKLSIWHINPLPMLQALADRDCPLEHVTVRAPPWEEFSEEEWAQLEEAASCAKVVKVKVKVNVCSSDQGSTVLAAGLVKNKVLKEVTLYNVPAKLEKSVRQILQSNTELTVVVRLLF